MYIVNMYNLDYLAKLIFSIPDFMTNNIQDF